MQEIIYWSGTDASHVVFTWRFYTFSGYQTSNLETWEEYAWALRDGDVAAVLEPGVLAMFGLTCLAKWHAGGGSGNRGKWLIRTGHCNSFNYNFYINCLDVLK